MIGADNFINILSQTLFWITIPAAIVRYDHVKIAKAISQVTVEAISYPGYGSSACQKQNSPYLVWLCDQQCKCEALFVLRGSFYIQLDSIRQSSGV